MLNDKTTLKDLSILGSTGSIFHLLDHCITQLGREALRKHIIHPPDSYDALQKIQDVIRFFSQEPQVFPVIISNGTLVMLEKFFDSADHLPQKPSGFNLLFNSFFQKTLNRNEYTFNQFSVSHLSDFVKGMKELTMLLDTHNVPARLKEILEQIKTELDNQRLTEELLNVGKNTLYKQLATLSYLARRELKSPVTRLLKLYSLLDAWQSIGKSAVVNHWNFPSLKPSTSVLFEASELYHPLLNQPTSYNIKFNEYQNFLLLTGANMSGKTTFMRSLGIAALLAHIGAAVPAKEMSLSFLQGIITNMHVEDNILLGESLFMAEVQRIKQTAQKVTEPRPHLVLMDELFKGTNVHDAYECTKAVVDGLLRHKHHIMVLSTHLYEVAQQFKERAGINFGYFVTDLTQQGNYSFTYELKTGISNDRIGYRILQKEGVIELLEGKDG
jgi:DNA mismatch repair protein MutS